MAKKKNVEKPQRHMTKRALSSIKRQQRRRNFIFYGGILIIAVVLVIVFVGLYIGEVRPYQQTVAKVYDREFDARYLMDAVEYFGRFYTQETYLSYLSTLVYSSQTTVIDSELIKRGAEGFGIVVADDEVKESLKEKEIPVNDASIDLTRMGLLNERLLEEHFEPLEPANAEQVHVMAMFLESESQALTVTDELAASDNFTGLAEEYSLDSYTKEAKGDPGWHTREYLEYQMSTDIPVEYAFGADIGTLSQPLYDERSKPVGYWLVDVLERREDNTQAHVQVILLGSEEEADEARQRLDDGEDFGELARELSQHEVSREAGGDLDWVAEGSISEAFDAHVFEPETGDVGILDPFRDDSIFTTGGYWMVRVLDREENRPVEEEEKEFLADRAYQDWSSQLWEDATEEIDQSYLTAEIMQWIVEKLTEKYQ